MFTSLATSALLVVSIHLGRDWQIPPAVMAYDAKATGAPDYFVLHGRGGHRVFVAVQTYKNHGEYVDANVAIAEGRRPDLDLGAGRMRDGILVIDEAVIGDDEDPTNNQPAPANPPTVKLADRVIEYDILGQRLRDNRRQR